MTYRKTASVTPRYQYKGFWIEMFIDADFKNNRREENLCKSGRGRRRQEKGVTMNPDIKVYALICINFSLLKSGLG